MSNGPIMSVSGIRGIFGETIDEKLVARMAFVQTKSVGGGKVIVGRDTRNSGEKLAYAAFSGIRAGGGIPVSIGIAPTPTTCVSVPALQGSTGIIITASHNPNPYNGYKMAHRTGRLFRGHECEKVYDAYRHNEFPSDIPPITQPEMVERVDATQIHIDRIISHVDVDRIRAGNLFIAIDSINGAAGAIFPQLLDRLHVRWVGVHNKLDGDFVHNPEPRPEHLGDLASLLRETRGIWGGFVFDPDADRLATMGENGEEISEEMTLVFALQNLLEREHSPICTNLSTSMLIDDVAKKNGLYVVRTKIGEANVVEGMELNNCRIGGEGNGGVIYPPISTVRDGIAGLALICELMAKTGLRITELAKQWPVYPLIKEKIPCDSKDPSEIIDRLQNLFSGEQIDTTDGLKIIRPYGWVHLRPSNTEPIIRCYAEAQSYEQARQLAAMITEKVMEV